jgi:BirA family transcriptional regulator, biotin operon repressor / biotin---[acetyl-CoA-carboxylase] ligase
MDPVPLRLWLGVPVEEWRDRWRLPGLHVFQSLGSTNDVARDLAAADAAEGTAIMAEYQAQGRGRRGGEWLAAPDSSLLLSMIFRPATPGAESVLSLRLGLAAACAIEEAADLPVSLKWPNDLLVHGRKVAGILCEGAVEDGRSLHLVAGIGINVSQHDDAWPRYLQHRASSLQARADRPVDRADLAGRLTAHWLAAGRAAEPRLSEPELHELRRRDALLGMPITVDDRPAGTAQGIAPDGALIAGSADAPRRVIAGTVRVQLPQHQARP